jgi:hypothetical protein
MKGPLATINNDIRSSNSNEGNFAMSSVALYLAMYAAEDFWIKTAQVRGYSKEDGDRAFRRWLAAVRAYRKSLASVE